VAAGLGGIIAKAPKSRRDGGHYSVSVFFVSLRAASWLRVTNSRVVVDQSSLGAKPFLLIREASLSSIIEVSTLRGCLRAQSMQVVTPGSASIRSGAMGASQSWHRRPGGAWGVS
jgi:hypothetical protein